MQRTVSYETYIMTYLLYVFFLLWKLTNGMCQTNENSISFDDSQVTKIFPETAHAISPK